MHDVFRKLAPIVALGALVATLTVPARAEASAIAHAIVPGFERFFNDAKADPVRGGMLLLGELNCTACHQPEKAVGARVARKEPPVLDRVGSRVRPEYLRAFLSDPHGTKPGTTMPNLLATLPDPEKAETVEALVHYLAATGGLTEAPPSARQVVNGKTLYHQVGCVACHGPREEDAPPLPTSMPLGDLARKYTIPSLSAFLLDPLKVRPSGRMPGLMLKPEEASDLAHYLMRDARVKLRPNLKYTYYEGSGWEKLPDLDTLKPKAEGQSPGFDVGLAKRAGDFALKFEGYLQIDNEGPHRFYLTSDDGSKLVIDGNLVVDNDGIHPPTEKIGRAFLTKGLHPFVASIFNGGGGCELSVEFDGKGLPRQSVDPFVYLTREGRAALAGDKASKKDVFVLDTALAEKGKAHFAKLGCASCHRMNNVVGPAVPAENPPGRPYAARPLAALDSVAGCLAPEPVKGVPHYHLSAPQRAALLAALKGLKVPSPAPTSRDVIARTMTTFNCYACHERDKVGGVEEARNAQFQTTQKEMGDEGRIPPNLNGVGGKLTDAWLKHVVNDGAKDRPYMLTRMPRFDLKNVGEIVKAFEESDPVEPVPTVDFGTLTPRRVKSTGRFLSGGQALGCIKCHNFKGVKAEGVQSIDMTIMTQRLNRDWFHRYLLDPQAYRPGTRMPGAWPKGKTMLPKVLDGDTRKQIEAIWQFLADGNNADEPYGLGRDPIPLVPEGEAILFRNFIKGAGPRAIGVGYPEKVNLAFDANNLTVALIWQGAFIDASRHWNGRGEGYQPPLGDNVVTLPAGPAFASLTKTDQPWPKTSARDLESRFRGYRLTKDERPTFLYDIGKIHVEDRPEAIAGKEYGTLRRSIALTAEAPVENLWFRAAVADRIEPGADGWYTINGEWKLRVGPDLHAVVRPADGKSELLVPVKFDGKQARIVEEFDW